jgi:hypothetical protein
VAAVSVVAVVGLVAAVAVLAGASAAAVLVAVAPEAVGSAYVVGLKISVSITTHEQTRWLRQLFTTP